MYLCVIRLTRTSPWLGVSGRCWFCENPRYKLWWKLDDSRACESGQQWAFAWKRHIRTSERAICKEVIEGIYQKYVSRPRLNLGLFILNVSVSVFDASGVMCRQTNRMRKSVIARINRVNIARQPNVLLHPK